MHLSCITNPLLDRQLCHTEIETSMFSLSKTWRKDSAKQYCIFGECKWVTILLVPLPLTWHCFHGLTHWGQLMHICISKLDIIGSDNGLFPIQCQAIIWSNIVFVLIGPLNQWNNEDIFIKENALEKVIYKMAAIWSQPQCVNSWVPCRHKMDLQL